MISKSLGFPLLTVIITVNTQNVSVIYLPKPHCTMSESWIIPHSFFSVSQTLLSASFLIQIFITFMWYLSPYNTTSMIKQLILDFSSKNRPHNLGESRPVWRLSLKAFEFGRRCCDLFTFPISCQSVFWLSLQEENRSVRSELKGTMSCQLLPGGSLMLLPVPAAKFLLLHPFFSACPRAFFKLLIAPHVPLIPRALFQTPLLYLQD